MNRALLALFCFATSLADVAAQSPLRITLDDAVTRGLEVSQRLAESTAREEAARAIEYQNQAAKLPQFSLTAAYTRINHVTPFSVPAVPGGLTVVYPDIPNNITSRLGLEWPIYSAGRLTALTRAASAEADATSRDHDAVRADVKLEVTRAFWAVITARASLDVVNQAVARTNAHLNDVRNQLNVGLVPPSDVLSIEAELAHQRMLSIEAANIVETTSTEFRRLQGLDPNAAFELVADLSGATLADPTAMTAAAVDEARANRPERKSLQLRISAASERVAAVSASGLPLVTAVGGYDMNRPNRNIFPVEEKWQPSWDMAFVLRWPLFDGGRVRAEVAEAVAGRKGVEARLRDFDAEVEVEVRQRIADVNSARASIEAAEAGVRAATEARRVVTERFNAGVATSTDVLNAQVAMLQAELDRTRALANLQLASARLDRAVGR